jgi:ubiquinone/menaquinone biosynthesis C-methylase UbiE
MHFSSPPSIIASHDRPERTPMRTLEAQRSSDAYALARTPQEYERLRAQSRAWEAATSRLLDQVGLASGASCLDAGCGPGETMRLMAQRVGPTGRVTGIDVDVPLGAQALMMLQNAGHHQCRFAPVDVTADGPIPDAPFDLVYARLLLYHLPERVTVLRRLWDAVAPGGHLLIQDYDIRGVSVLPTLDSLEELRRVIFEAFSASGCDVQIGARLPELFAQAGIGAPDGSDVSGRLEPLADAQALLGGVYRSILSAAIARGITTEDRSAATLAEMARDAERFPSRPTLWPLLIGAWKRKPNPAHAEPTR